MKIFQPFLIMLSVTLFIITTLTTDPASQQTNAQDFTIGSGQDYQNDTEFQADLFGAGESLSAHEDFLAFTGHLPPIYKLLLLDDEKT